jgi:hypothetical protein
MFAFSSSAMDHKVLHASRVDFSGFIHVGSIKNQETSCTEARHHGARPWVVAVDNWGKLGKREFLVCRDPQRLSEEIKGLIKRL